MKINRLHINSFGCLENVSLSFCSGFHLIDGPNESGKSTLHAFMRAMLFGLDKGRTRMAKDSGYSRYLPWNGNPAYGGSLEIEDAGITYSIYRNFDANRSTCRIFNETEHVEIDYPDAFLRGLLSGLTQQLFDDTLSVSQLTAAAGKPLTDELRNHIVNLRTSGASGIDVNAAITKLKQQKRELRSSFSRAASADAEELDRQIISLQRLAASSAIPSDMKELESQKKELEKLVRQYAQRQKELANEREKDQIFLERHQIGSEEQIDLVLKETDQIYDTLNKAEAQAERLSRQQTESKKTHLPDIRKLRKAHKKNYGRGDSADERQDDGKRPDKDQAQYIPPILLFIAGAFLFIFAFLVLSHENHSLLMAALLLIGGFTCMVSCCLHFLRSSDKKKHFNIDLDELYAHGITKKLLGEDEYDDADTYRDPDRQRNDDMNQASDWPRSDDMSQASDRRRSDDMSQASDRRRSDDMSRASDRQRNDDMGRASDRPRNADMQKGSAVRTDDGIYKDADIQVRLSAQRLDEMYRRFCPDGDEDATVPRLNAIADTMEACRACLIRLQNSGDAYGIKADADSLIENQQKLADVNDRLERSNKIAWQAERHNEELRGLLDRRDALEETLERNKRITDDMSAIDLAVNILNELSSTSFGSLGYYLDQRTSQIAEELTDGRCTDITVGADLEITIRQDSRLIPLSQASRGTTEQIWLALRLASIEFIWPDTDMPLFLDDTMITYDDERMTSTLRWLSDNYPGQVFIFTCHHRERKILNALSVPYRHVKM